MEQIYKKLPSEKVFILREIHLIDSISLIAHSTVFAGTSLHGNITAMSYAVPHFPLNEQVAKLTNYVKQWDIPHVKPCPDYSQIHEFYEKSTEMDNGLLLTNRNRLISHIGENITEICKIISSAGFDESRDLIQATISKSGYKPYVEGIRLEDGRDMSEVSELVRSLTQPDRAQL